MKILSNLKEDIQAWLNTIYIGEGKYKFAVHSLHPFSVDATTLAVDLEHMLGNDLRKKKEAVLHYLNSHQDPGTGLFKEDFEDTELDEEVIPRVKEMSRTYLGFQSAGAYRALEAHPLVEFSFYRELRDPDKMRDYLDNNMPWNKSPWGAGGMVDSAATMISMNIEMGFDCTEALEAVFAWLDKNQDKETGLWGNITAQGMDGLVNGGYHITRGTYFWHKRELPRVEKIIDSLIGHINSCPVFQSGKGDGCYDLDAFFMLSQCHKRVPFYRKDEIQAVCERRLMQLNYMKKADGGFSFEPDHAEIEHNYYKVTEGKKESDVQGTVFYLQTILSIQSILQSGDNLGFANSLTHGVGER